MTRQLTQLAAVIFIVCVALLGPAASVTQADEATGITVTGQGEVMVKPDALEIVGTISGEAQLAADAIQKYEQTAAAVTKAVEGLKIDGLKIERSGFQIGPSMPNQMGMMMPNQGAESAASMAVSEQMTIRITGVDQLEPQKLLEDITAVLDVAKDAGLSVGADMTSGMEMYIVSQMMGGGTGGPVRFTVADPKSARKKAYEAAMKDAHEKAETLAELAEVGLGKVKAISEQTVAEVPADDSPRGRMMAMMMGIYGMNSQGERSELSSATFGKIPVRVALSVTYGVK